MPVLKDVGVHALAGRVVVAVVAIQRHGVLVDRADPQRVGASALSGAVPLLET
jgi:hypothetical protein